MWQLWVPLGSLEYFQLHFHGLCAPRSRFCETVYLWESRAEVLVAGKTRGRKKNLRMWNFRHGGSFTAFPQGIPPGKGNTTLKQFLLNWYSGLGLYLGWWRVYLTCARPWVQSQVLYNKRCCCFYGRVSFFDISKQMRINMWDPFVPPFFIQQPPRCSYGLICRSSQICKWPKCRVVTWTILQVDPEHRG